MLSSSTKYECRRSALLANNDPGVMCSATQAGFRVRLSKAEVVESVGWRSEMGPGNPYRKRPLGFTGGMISFRGCARVAGTGSGAELVLVEDVGVLD